MMIRIVKMVFRDDAIEDFKELFEQNKERIRSVEGCLHLELWQDEHLPTRFMTYSHWTSEERLNAYRNSEVFADIWPKTKAFFAEKPEAWTMNRIHQLR